MINYNKVFYNKQIKKNFNKNYKIVGWGSKRSQEIRFKNIIKYFDKDQFSVLDIGCGLGDFYKFLKSKKIKFKYTGLDLNKFFIEECKKKYKSANFINTNFLNFKFKTKPDYIITSGSLNLPQDNYELFFKKVINKMYKNCNEKCIFNVLSGSSKKIYPFSAYADISKLSKFIDGISNYYLIDKSYLKHDISIILSKK